MRNKNTKSPSKTTSQDLKSSPVLGNTYSCRKTKTNCATITVTEKEKELAELVGWNFGLESQPKYLDNCINNQKIQLSEEDNSPVSIQAVIEYLALMWIQYQGTSKKFKSRLLDELVRNLKIHRKAAIRLMTSKVPPKQNQGRIKRTVKLRYSDLAKKHLILLWRKTAALLKN